MSVREETHKFYESDEGRALLRDLYPIFVSFVPFGARKIASLVADLKPNGQRKEDELTRSALKRWAESGQSYLWRSVSKSLRVLERLEVEMMAVPEIKEVLDDRAISIAQLGFATGVEKFFYGTLLNRVSRNYRDLQSRLNEVEGVYKISDTSFEEDDYSKVVTESTVAQYCFFSLVPDYSFLITNTFELDTSLDYPVYRKGSVGFSYVGANGEIYRFLIDRANPELRTIEFLEPHGYNAFGYEDFDPEFVTGTERYVSAFVVGAQSFEEFWKIRQSGVLNYDVIYEPASLVVEKLVRKHFSGIIWEIPI